MISMIIGLPGSGKSLLLSYIAHRAIVGKRLNFKGFNISSVGKIKGFDKYERIYTNFPADGCYKLDFERLGYDNYHDCLMLIDEVQLFADSRNFKSFGDNLKYFFSMHRHYKTDIVICSQSYGAVDARIRSLIHRLYYIDSLGSFIRCREIIPYFDVHGKIDEGADYAGGFNTKYFYAPRMYKYNDTFANIKEIDLHPVTLEAWFQLPTIDKAINESHEEHNTTETVPPAACGGGSSGGVGSST